MTDSITAPRSPERFEGQRLRELAERAVAVPSDQIFVRLHRLKLFLAQMTPESWLALLAQRDALQREVERLEKSLSESRKDWSYHSECRPNRRQAEAAIADAKATNDRWADEVSIRRAAEAQRDALAAALRESRMTLQALLLLFDEPCYSRNVKQRLVELSEAAVANAQSALHALVDAPEGT